MRNAGDEDKVTPSRTVLERRDGRRGKAGELQSHVEIGYTLVQLS